MTFSLVNRSANTLFVLLENYFFKPLTTQQKKVTLIALTLFSVIASSALFNLYFFLAKPLHPIKDLKDLDHPIDNLKEDLLDSSPLIQVSNLVLHLDVNRTILADDTAAGFSLQDTLALILAENYRYKWKDEELSFQDYISSLIPGPHYGPIKKQRQIILKDFIYLLKNCSFRTDSSTDFSKLKESHHQGVQESIQKINLVKIQVLEDLIKLKHEQAEDFDALREKIINDFEAMEAKFLQEQHSIFPSFFRLIEWLREKKDVNFHLILRTFGDDAPRISFEVTKKFPTEKFTHKGFYLNGKWEIALIDESQTNTLEKAQDVYRFLKSKNYQHLMIKDDWKEWNAQEEHQKHGKRFLVKLNAKHTHAILFDDNLVLDPETEKNIITAVNIKNDEMIPIPSLLEKKIVVRTDQMRAILDNEYFVKVVQDSLKLNGKMIS
jgi:hypothetical protein